MNVDYIVKNAWVFLTFRQVFEKRDVAVANGKICAVLPEIRTDGQEWEGEPAVLDAGGRYLIPGLVDIHMHIESSMTFPEEFSRIALPHGTTAVVADAHEIANVFGMEGLQSFMGQETDMDIFWAIPSSVPATSMSQETSGAEITEADVAKLLENPRVLCLGEVMNFKALVEETGDTRIRRLIRLCRERRGRDIRLEGHCPKVSGLQLNQFIAAEIDADHTQQTAETIVEKSDLGMFLELQGKSISQETIGAVCSHGLYDNVALVTDDTMPDRLLTGHLNRILRMAVEAGMPPEKAVYCATWTPSRRMHLDDRGMIGPGKIADFLLLDDLECMEPYAVFKDGRLAWGGDALAGAGKLKKGPEASGKGRNCPRFPEAFYHSVHCRAAVTEDFILRVPDEYADRAVSVTVNVIRVNPAGTMTTAVQREIPVINGVVCWNETGLCLAVIYERHGRNGNVAQALVEQAFQKPGAAATTWSHDSHNLLVLGNSPEDMLLAQKRVRELSGGYVAAAEGRILAEAELAVAGIISDKPLEMLAQELGAVRAAMQELGYVNTNVIMSMSTLALPVSPALKLTDYGLMDVRTQQRVDLIAEVHTR